MCGNQQQRGTITPAALALVVHGNRAWCNSNVDLLRRFLL